MKYCMSTMCVDSSSLNDKIDAISSAGFDSIEMWIKDIDGQDIKSIKKKTTDSGLIIAEIVKLEGWFEDDYTLMNTAPNHASIMNECKRRMDITKTMGSDYIVVLPSRSDRGFYKSIEEGRDHYYELLRIGEEIGVCPTLEFTGQSNQINTINSVLDFILPIKHPLVKIIIDNFHVWRGGSNLEDIYKIDKNLISIVHISDVDQKFSKNEYKDRNRVMPGDGIINIKKFIQIILKTGFDGHISLGCYNHENWKKDPYQIAIEGITKMRKVIE